MSTRLRSVVTVIIAAIMIMSSVPLASAATLPDRVRGLRAEWLAARQSSATQEGVGIASAMAVASTETTIPVIESSWYKDASGVQHFDGYFGTGSPGLFEDVWVMVEFMNASMEPVGSEEIMANEYVVEGEGSWSAQFSMLPAGTTHARATVYGTPTDMMAYMPTAAEVLGTTTLAGNDRRIDGNVTFGMTTMPGMPADPTMADLVVSSAEIDMGHLHDVAVGFQDAATPAPIMPGMATPWFAWGAQPADPSMIMTQRFVHYSAVEYSTMTVRASTLAPAYGTVVKLSGKTVDSTGTPVAGMPVVALTGSGATAGSGITAADGSYAINVRPSVRTYYTVVSLGNSFIASAQSARVLIDPKVYLTTPVSPSAVYLNRAFYSIGYLRPRHTAGTYPVLIKAYRKISGRWVLKKTVKAKASNYSSYTKYTARYYLPTRGYWKLVAYHDSTAHYPTTSGARYITVR